MNVHKGSFERIFVSLLINIIIINKMTDRRSIEQEYAAFKTVTLTSRKHDMFFVLTHSIVQYYEQ